MLLQYRHILCHSLVVHSKSFLLLCCELRGPHKKSLLSGCHRLLEDHTRKACFLDVIGCLKTTQPRTHDDNVIDLPWHRASVTVGKDVWNKIPLENRAKYFQKCFQT